MVDGHGELVSEHYPGFAGSVAALEFVVITRETLGLSGAVLNDFGERPLQVWVADLGIPFARPLAIGGVIQICPACCCDWETALTRIL